LQHAARSLCRGWPGRPSGAGVAGSAGLRAGDRTGAATAGRTAPAPAVQTPAEPPRLPREPGRLEPDAKRFGTHPEPTVPARNRPDLPRLAATPAAAQCTAGAGAWRAGHRCGAGLRLRIAIGLHRRVSRAVRRHARRVLSRCPARESTISFTPRRFCSAWRSSSLESAMSIRTYQNHTPKLGERVFVDPSAVLIGDIEIGEDSSVWPE